MVVIDVILKCSVCGAELRAKQYSESVDKNKLATYYMVDQCAHCKEDDDDDDME
jgi:hypothetical protein